MVQELVAFWLTVFVPRVLAAYRVDRLELDEKVKVQYQMFFARGASALDKRAVVPWEDLMAHHLMLAFFIAAQQEGRADDHADGTGSRYRTRPVMRRSLEILDAFLAETGGDLARSESTLAAAARRAGASAVRSNNERKISTPTGPLMVRQKSLSSFIIPGIGRRVKIRKWVWLRRMVKHWAFGAAINMAVLASAVVSTLNTRDRQLVPTEVDRSLSLSVSIICLIEAALKILAFGMWFAPDAYLKNPWNLLDGLTGLAMVLEAVLSTETYGFQAIRLLRVLPALLNTLIFILERLHFFRMGVAESAALSPSAYVDVACLAALIFAFLVYAASVFVPLYGGRFWRCSISGHKTLVACSGSGIIAVPADAGGGGAAGFPPNLLFVPRAWLTPAMNFDTLPRALLSSFALFMCLDWSLVLDQAASIESPGGLWIAVPLILFSLISKVRCLAHMHLY
jgi:hypothetical protein